MMDRWKTAYLSGLTHMASSAAAGIGPSYIDAVFFGPPDPLAAFSRYFGVPLRKEDLSPAEEPLETVLGQWMGDRRIAAGLLHWIGFHVGTPGQVWLLPEGSPILDAMDRDGGGKTPFFFLEDLCFTQFPDGMACFLIGNDE